MTEQEIARKSVLEALTRASKSFQDPYRESILEQAQRYEGNPCRKTIEIARLVLYIISHTVDIDQSRDVAHIAFHVCALADVLHKQQEGPAFREHKGGLAESMETMVPIPNRAALIAHCRELLEQWDFEFDDTAVHLVAYMPDDRIGWNPQSLVVIEGYGPIGMTDLPPDQNTDP